MEEKITDQAKERINEILEQGISVNNLEQLDKLVDIYKDIKEVECMYGNYGNYGGRRPGYDTYGNYMGYGNYNEYGRGNYGARGRDMRYRGDESLDRMYSEYGRYNESRQRYGAGEETDKSFHYMTKALEDFIRVLHEEAETPQQKQMLNETLQRSMM